MVDDTQPGTESADSARGHASCRIDRWSADGWGAVRSYADPGLAERALEELRRREPDALLRLVRRIEPAGMAGGPSAPARPRAGRRSRDEETGTAPAGVATLVRAAGALGLVVLATLACIAAFSDWDDPVATPRSTVAAPPDPTAAGPVTEPASSDPGPFAGAWALDAPACTGDLVEFLPGREIRVTAGVARELAVATYHIEAGHIEAGGTLQVGYAGGGSTTYRADGDGLRLVRARIADIQITPQLPWLLRPCRGDATSRLGSEARPEVQPNAVDEAFRLAVRVGDDLAATLALAHGLSAAAPLSGGSAPLALAMAYDRPVIVAKLLAAGADPDVRGNDGRTPLSRAVLDGRPALVEALLAGGADPRRTDADGARPLDHAAAAGDEPMIDLLMAAGR